MKNYRNSDYAINKFSKGIVYRFANRTMEITLADYLAENPDKTEQDFIALKELSDSLYHQQVKNENNQTRKNVTLHGEEYRQDLATLSLETEYFESFDEQRGLEAIRKLLDSGCLTSIQERRFRLYFFKGLTLRGIGKMEGVSHTGVHDSIQSAVKKLKNIFRNGG